MLMATAIVLAAAIAHGGVRFIRRAAIIKTRRGTQVPDRYYGWAHA